MAEMVRRARPERHRRRLRNRRIVFRHGAIFAVAALLATFSAVDALGALAGTAGLAPLASERGRLRAIDQAIADRPGSVAPGVILDAARAALEENPLDARAVRLLAIGNALRGTPGQAPSVALAQRISRRDLGTNLWAIETNVGAGDIDAALRNYDRALRTSPASQAVLFPRLAAAISDPLIAPRFVPLLRSDPPWMPPLLSLAIGSTTAPRELAALARASRGFSGVTGRRQLLEQLLQRLANDGLWADAKALLALYPTSGATVAESFAVNSGTTDRSFGPFAWQAIGGAGVDSRLISGTGAGQTIAISASPGAGGPAMTKFAALPPGRYRLSAQVRINDDPETTSLRFELICSAPARSVLLDLATTASAEQILRGGFAVDTGCQAQQLMIYFSGPQSQRDSSATVEAIALARES